MHAGVAQLSGPPLANLWKSAASMAAAAPKDFRVKCVELNSASPDIRGLIVKYLLLVLIYS
jgi:hypothetical protein